MVQKILSGQTFTNISSLRCDLDLQRSNPIFPHDTLAYDAVLSNKVWLQIDQQFRRYSKNNHILIIQALTVTSILKIVNQSFRMTHCLMIIHHLTKFGKKWLSGSGDTEQTQSDTLTLSTFAVTLTLNAIIPFFHRTLPLMMLYYQTKFGCKLISCFQATTEIVIF